MGNTVEEVEDTLDALAPPPVPKLCGEGVTLGLLMEKLSQLIAVGVVPLTKVWNVPRAVPNCPSWNVIACVVPATMIADWVVTPVSVA